MTRPAPYRGPDVVRRVEAKIGTPNQIGMCQLEVRTLFGVPSVGDFDGNGASNAHDAWRSAVAHGRVVRETDPARIPAGAYIYFSGGTHGHVAVALGGGMCASTDWPRGRWGRVSIATLISRWGGPMPGYIAVTGNGYDVSPTTTPTQEEDMPITTAEFARMRQIMREEVRNHAAASTYGIASASDKSRESMGGGFRRTHRLIADVRRLVAADKGIDVAALSRQLTASLIDDLADSVGEIVRTELEDHPERSAEQIAAAVVDATAARLAREDTNV